MKGKIEEKKKKKKGGKKHSDFDHKAIIFQALFVWKLDFFFSSPGNHFSKICLMNNLMPTPLNIHTKFGSVSTKPRGIRSEEQKDTPALYIYIYASLLAHILH